MIVAGVSVALDPLTASVMEDNVIKGNYIGTDVTGTTAFGVGQNGISLGFSPQAASTETPGPTGTIIGGTTQVERNLIAGFTQHGVRTHRAVGTVIQGNYIGTDASGQTAVGNGEAGIAVDYGQGALIADNLISGNAGEGVKITQGGGHAILGNQIGLAADGTTRLGNFDGILLSSTTNVQIGGTEVSEWNTISGSARYGIGIEASSNTIIQGNRIGTDRDGMVAVPNGLAGVELIGYATDTLIGGIDPGAGNLISGNPYGVRISGSGLTERTRIEGNWIGTTVSGDAPLANGVGVQVLAAGGSLVDDLLIGGSEPGAGNVISGNTEAGIHVIGTADDENVSIEGNRIGTDPSGEFAVPNGIGVLIEDAIGVVVGGTESPGPVGPVDLVGLTPGTFYGGGTHILEIDGRQTEIDSYQWSAGAFGSQADAGSFVIQTTLGHAGAMFADVGNRAALGDVTLRSYREVDNQRELYQTWTLENARVEAYSVLDQGDLSVDPTVELAFVFDAIASKSVAFDPAGTPDGIVASRWSLVDPDPDEGGGAGPEVTRSTGAYDLLQIGDMQIDVASYSWSAFDSGQPQAGEFVIRTDLQQASGLYVDLARQTNLGTLMLTSADALGTLAARWELADAQVTSFAVASADQEDEAEQVEIAFSFDAITAELFENDTDQSGLGSTVSRWDLTDPSRNFDGGPGPERTTVSGFGNLLQIGDDRLDMLDYQWEASGFGQPYAGDFIVQTYLSQAGGLFAALADQTALGDIQVTIATPSGELVNAWMLGDAQLVSYTLQPTQRNTAGVVELAFRFDTIELTTPIVGEVVGSPPPAVARWDLAEPSQNLGGGLGPYQTRSTGRGRLLTIGDKSIHYDAFGWTASNSGEADAGQFWVDTSIDYAGSLFVDLARGVRFDSVVLTDSPKQLDVPQYLERWQLDGAQVVGYSLLPAEQDSTRGLRLSFQFDTITQELTTPDAAGGLGPTVTSRWNTVDSSENLGGGAGPLQTTSTGEGDLLRVGDAVIEIDSFAWDASHRESARRPSDGPQAGYFTIDTNLWSAAGLFVELAEGRSLGTVELTSVESRFLYERWQLDQAQVVGYQLLPAEDQEPAILRLTFGFDAIQSEHRTRDPQSGATDHTVPAGWTLTDPPVVSGGGPGPAKTTSTGVGNLLTIAGETLDVLSAAWGISHDGEPLETPFVVELDALYGAALYADLAAQTALGDLTLTSTNYRNERLRAWNLHECPAGRLPAAGRVRFRVQPHGAAVVRLRNDSAGYL